MSEHLDRARGWRAFRVARRALVEALWRCDAPPPAVDQALEDLIIADLCGAAASEEQRAVALRRLCALCGVSVREAAEFFGTPASIVVLAMGLVEAPAPPVEPRRKSRRGKRAA